MHTNSTTNYSLPQFLPTDKPAWLTDVNPAYLAIDNAMKANADAADAAQTDATQALADAAGANAIATQADAKASGAVASLSEQFLDTNTYSVGEYVIFNNILYVCIEPVTTPGPWTGSVNWERASLDSIATTLNAAVANLNSRTGSNINVSDTEAVPIATRLSDVIKVVRYEASNETSVNANAVIGLTGANVGYNSIPAGYTPIAAYFTQTRNNDFFYANINPEGYGSRMLCVVRNVNIAAATGVITAIIIFVKNSYLDTP